MSMSTSHATQSKGVLKVGTRLVSQTGALYYIDRVLQRRTEPDLSCVYLATYVSYGSPEFYALDC